MSTVRVPCFTPHDLTPGPWPVALPVALPVSYSAPAAAAKGRSVAEQTEKTVETVDGPNFVGSGLQAAQDAAQAEGPTAQPSSSTLRSTGGLGQQLEPRFAMRQGRTNHPNLRTINAILHISLNHVFSNDDS